MRKRAKWVVGIVGIVIGIASVAYAEPSCEETKAKLEVYAQVVIQARTQAEQQVAAMAVEVQRLKQENEALKKQAEEVKVKAPAKEGKAQ